MRYLTPHGSISGVMQVKVKFIGNCLGVFLPVERFFHSSLLPSFLVVAPCSCFCFVRGVSVPFLFPLLTSCKLMEGKARNGWKKNRPVHLLDSYCMLLLPPLPPLPPQRFPGGRIH